MEKVDPHAGVTSDKTRIQQAEARTAQAETRTEQAEARTEQARARTELAETRTEQAETRTEMAKTRTEQAETRTEQAEVRTEQAEATLQHLLHKEVDLRQEIPARVINNLAVDGTVDRENPLGQLTSRQRETLRLIAEGRNTKGIAELLQVSPKTVDYHRMKLMNALNVHDIPGLVRFALRVGLIRPDP